MKVTNQMLLYVLFFFLTITSCSIYNGKNFSNSNLSKMIEIQTKQLLIEEVEADFSRLNNEIKLLKTANSTLQATIDSLLLDGGKTEKNKKEDNQSFFVFFDKSGYTLNKESTLYINTYLGEHAENHKMNVSHINIIGLSDSSGDSSENVNLAYKRALAVKRYLTNELCINPQNINIETQANINTCFKSLYRSAKISVTTQQAME
jgi:outer membrane protein OmpA-like peptidoglycan-associated protein